MDEEEFEGTLILEKLVELGALDAFFKAVDSDDFETALTLMKRAKIDRETIAIVLKKMANADGEH